MPPNRLEQLTAAAAGITGRRYCSSHNGEAGSDTGEYIVRGNVRRWICFDCKTRTDHASTLIGDRRRRNR